MVSLYNLLYSLPKELREHIFSYTPTQTLIEYCTEDDYSFRKRKEFYIYKTEKYHSLYNNSYLINYIEDNSSVFTQKIDTLSNIDYQFCEQQELITEIQDYNYYSPERNEYTNNTNLKLTLKVLDDIKFNNLTLQIYNPGNRPLNELIDEINFEISGRNIDTIFDIQSQLEVMSQINGRKHIHKNNYSFIPLSFLSDKILLYNLPFQPIRIDILLKTELSNEIIPKLYADTYKIKNRNYQDNITDSMKGIMYYNQFTGPEVYQYEKTIKSRLNFKCSIFIMYLTGDLSNIENIKLIFNGTENFFDGSIEELNAIKKLYGFTFEPAAFIFSGTIDSVSKTIDFNKIDTISLIITFINESIRFELNCYCISANILSIESG